MHKEIKGKIYFYCDNCNKRLNRNYVFDFYRLRYNPSTDEDGPICIMKSDMPIVALELEQRCSSLLCKECFAKRCREGIK